MAAEVINLNKARKARDKDARKAEAAGNRAKFGRSKAQASAARTEVEKAARRLDEARRERGDD
jgi:hypothetical protein